MELIYEFTVNSYINAYTKISNNNNEPPTHNQGVLGLSPSETTEKKERYKVTLFSFCLF